MKRAIRSATYEYYNANNAGRDTTDCVNRSIATAFNLDYVQVHRMLLAKQKELGASNWKLRTVWQRVVYDLGGSPIERLPFDQQVTVEDFTDAHPSGTYLLLTNDKPWKAFAGDHLTCIIDGHLYDSWNSLDQYVIGYSSITTVEHHMTDLSSYISDLASEGSRLLSDLYDKYQDKYQLSGYFQINKTKQDAHGIKFRCMYKDDKLVSSPQLFDISAVFSPEMTVDEARKKMIDTLKIRMYDRFYAIAKSIAQNTEALALFEESGYTEKDIKDAFITSAAQRFYNSLPGWVKPFVLYADVSHPGDFSNSYVLDILPIKGDPNKRQVSFEGYTSDMIKRELAAYRKKFVRVYQDYSLDDVEMGRI